MKTLKAFLSFLVLLFVFSFVYAEKTNGMELNPEQMKNQSEESFKRVQEIEKIILNLNNEAIKEKDIKWKLCLDDVLVSIKGIVASISSAKARMSDLINVQKLDAANNQFILIKGLSDSAEKSLTEAYACQKQLTKVGTKTSVVQEEDKEETGTYGKESSVDEAMGVGFGDDFVNENPSVDDMSDGSSDSAGTDGTGGPSDTPNTEGGDTNSENQGDDIIKIPPDAPVSAE